jgi:hypothetical protein
MSLTKITVNRKLNPLKYLALALGCLSLFGQESQAAGTWSYNQDNMDTLLFFRKTGEPNPYDLEVDLGSISNFVALPVGTATNISGNFYPLSQLAHSIGISNFEAVKFSVMGSCGDEGFTYIYPNDTTWYTIPRSDPAVPTTPYARQNDAQCSTFGSWIDSIGVNGTTYSHRLAVGPTNNTTVVEIPPGNAESCEADLNPGNVKGSAPAVVENAAPNPFSSSLVSDLYIEVPIGDADPFQGGTTSGNAFYLGYFTFNTDGSLTFTRAASTPAQPVLTITSSGSAITISFTAVSTATYSLIYTNTSGLTAPRSTWPTLGSSITGVSGTTNFTDSATASGRVYSVTAH